MPSLYIKKVTQKEINKGLSYDCEPIAVIKANKPKDKNLPLHGHFLCFDEGSDMYVDTGENDKKCKKKPKKKRIRKRPMIKEPEEKKNIKSQAISLDPKKYHFELLPDITNHGTNHKNYYIYGASGTGKSFLAMSLAKKYYKLFYDVKNNKKRDIFLISQLDGDDTIDEIEDLQKFEINDFLTTKPDINDLANSFVIFDDIEGLNKKTSAGVHSFVTDICTMGRCHRRDEKGNAIQGNITMVYISHLPTNRKKTKQLISESHYVITFPKKCNQNDIKYLMGDYCGLNTNQLKLFKKLPVCRDRKWCLLYKPHFIMSAYRAEIIDDIE